MGLNVKRLCRLVYADPCLGLGCKGVGLKVNGLFRVVCSSWELGLGFGLVFSVLHSCKVWGVEFV